MPEAYFSAQIFKKNFHNSILAHIKKTFVQTILMLTPKLDRILNRIQNFSSVDQLLQRTD